MSPVGSGIWVGLQICGLVLRGNSKCSFAGGSKSLEVGFESSEPHLEFYCLGLVLIVKSGNQDCSGLPPVDMPPCHWTDSLLGTINPISFLHKLSWS